MNAGGPEAGRAVGQCHRAQDQRHHRPYRAASNAAPCRTLRLLLHRCAPSCRGRLDPYPRWPWPSAEAFENCGLVHALNFTERKTSRDPCNPGPRHSLGESHA